MYFDDDAITSRYRPPATRDPLAMITVLTALMGLGLFALSLATLRAIVLWLAA